MSRYCVIVDKKVTYQFCEDCDDKYCLRDMTFLIIKNTSDFAYTSEEFNRRCDYLLKDAEDYILVDCTNDLLIQKYARAKNILYKQFSDQNAMNKYLINKEVKTILL